MSKRKDNTGDDKVRVVLPVDTGAKRVGTYIAGQVYTLPHAEAERLVRVKGFKLVEED